MFPGRVKEEGEEDEGCTKTGFLVGVDGDEVGGEVLGVLAPDELSDPALFRRWIIFSSINARTLILAV